MRKGATFVVTVFLALLSFQSVSAQTCPTDYTPYKGVCFPDKTGLSTTRVETIVMNVVNWMLAVLGFIAIVGFVVSGIQYLMSAGDEGTIETAKRNMKYSLIGVVVALSGRVLITAINNMLNASAVPF